MGFMDKISSVFKTGVDEYDYEEDDDATYAEEDNEKPYEEPRVSKPEKKNAFVPKRRVQVNETAVHYFKPKSFDDARTIVDAFLEDKTIVMNFEGVDLAISQRVLDIVTGACIAVGGNLQKVSNFVFIATPSNVDVSGEFQDDLTGSFDTL